MQSTEYKTFLFLAVFVASGISFLPGKIPPLLVRLTVALVGIVSFLLISAGLIFAVGFAAGFGARSFGEDGVRMLGVALVAFYFLICALTCLPIIPLHFLRSLGLGLHFVYLPIAVGLIILTAGSIEIPLLYRIDHYSRELALGLAYAMLWFRMVDNRTRIMEGSLRPNVGSP